MIQNVIHVWLKVHALTMFWGKIIFFKVRYKYPSYRGEMWLPVSVVESSIFDLVGRDESVCDWKEYSIVNE